jgi:ABC-type transporter Mla MlaB component
VAGLLPKRTLARQPIVGKKRTTASGIQQYISNSVFFAREMCMNIYTKGTVAHLQGDLTHSGVTDNIINSLSVSLQQVASGGGKKFRIDCGKIGTADIRGLQLLYVWMQCARFRGVEPELVNLSGTLQKIMQKMGLGDCFTSKTSSTPDPLFKYSLITTDGRK